MVGMRRLQSTLHKSAQHYDSIISVDARITTDSLTCNLSKANSRANATKINFFFRISTHQHRRNQYNVGKSCSSICT
jgi:hypothetical protein